MKFIDESMSIYQILTTYPYLINDFKKHGMGKFEQDEILKKLGPLLKLKTALTSININHELFVNELNHIIEEHEKIDDFVLADSPERQRDLTLLALLPCGMKMPFTRAFDEFITKYNEKHNTQLKYLIEGNVNHELSYYSYIESISTSDELPDILISSDINSFYHDSFKKDYIEKGLFIDTSITPINKTLADVGFQDPSKHFTMLSANILVLVSVDELLGDRKRPETWKELLNPEYHKSIVMRGDHGFFCNAVLLPFYKMYGLEAVKKFGRSVVNGLHPSEMIKMIDSRKSDVPPLYVMPYFFAQKIKHKERISIIVPQEGALISPVQMLVKKSSAPKLKEIIDFICGQNLGQIFADAYFPSTNADVNNSAIDIDSYFWLQWDFLYNNDIGSLKKEVENTFLQEYELISGGV